MCAILLWPVPCVKAQRVWVGLGTLPGAFQPGLEPSAHTAEHQRMEWSAALHPALTCILPRLLSQAGLGKWARKQLMFSSSGISRNTVGRSSKSGNFTHGNSCNSIIKGGDGLVLLSLLMGSSCSGISWEKGLCKWKKWPNLPRVLTSLLSFNLLCALGKNPTSGSRVRGNCSWSWKGRNGRRGASL